MSLSAVYEIAIYNTGLSTCSKADAVKYKTCDAPIKTVTITSDMINEQSSNPQRLYYFWKGDKTNMIMNKVFTSEASYKKYLKENKEQIKSTYGKLGHEFFVKPAEFNFGGL